MDSADQDRSPRDAAEEAPPYAPAAGDNNDENAEETRIRQSLLERPSFTVKTRLALIFFSIFIISAAIAAAGILMFSAIQYRIRYISLADRLSNEIQHARRIEKNFFLYNADLAEIGEHLDTADQLLDQAASELGRIVGVEELEGIRLNLDEYREVSLALQARSGDVNFRKSDDFTYYSNRFRYHGAIALERVLFLSRKEREQVAKGIRRMTGIYFVLLGAMLVLFVFIAYHINRHIVLRLNRLMQATQRFAEGNFLPIRPKRKYKDEFSNLAIALNHMMYEINKRQKILMESQKLREIGNLTAGIAHELNNPLNNIIITADVMREGFDDLDRAEVEEMMEDLVNQGERAQKIVQNLLDFARQSETDKEYVYVNDIIHETIQLARNQIRMQTIRLETKLKKALSPILGDRKLISQVFLNLILNAIDAMPDGGTIHIETREGDVQGYISARFTDTGSGIPQHLIASVFNPFFTTKATGEGTGLGLSVSRGIIEKHGGEIKVESVEGQGSVFTVSLPTVSIPAGPEHAAEEGAERGM
jgi:two-component system NtrC family sensor kinase